MVITLPGDGFRLPFPVYTLAVPHSAEQGSVQMVGMPRVGATVPLYTSSDRAREAIRNLEAVGQWVPFCYPDPGDLKPALAKIQARGITHVSIDVPHGPDPGGCCRTIQDILDGAVSDE